MQAAVVNSQVSVSALQVLQGPRQLVGLHVTCRNKLQNSCASSLGLHCWVRRMHVVAQERWCCRC